MFAPNGSVDRIYVTAVNGAYSAVQVISPIYLLVGRREQVVDPPDPTNTTTNLNDITSLWVAINASTGMIVVTDMAASGTTDCATAAQQSRAFARQSDAMGGK